MADKVIKAQVKLAIQAGKANPAPPVGSTLGPQGINLMQFCKEFNDKTSSMVGAIPVVVTIYSDRSFEFVIKTQAVADLVKQAIGITAGAKDPLRQKVGKITKAQIQAIAEKKMVDLNAFDMVGAMSMVEGTCKSMGVTVID
jgi:large subunit ribosomal protein L11